MNNNVVVLDLIYKIIAIIVSLITVIGFLGKFTIPKNKKQLLEYNKYTDRRKQLKSAISDLNDGIRIINVYGKKGVGKSYFLKYISDYINRKIPKKYIKDIKKVIKIKNRTRVIYFEANEYSKDTEILNDFISSYSNKNSKNTSTAVKKILIHSLWYKKIVIIFDNITNECVENAVENIIKDLLPMSKKFCFILGSIEKLTLPKLGANKKQIEVVEFSDDEIVEYSKNCNKCLSFEDIKNILNSSNGLPIMVDLMISNNDYSNNELYNKYIYKLFSDLKKSDEVLSKTTIYIALLSLVNSTVSVKLLNSISYDFSVNNISLNKLHLFSLIKYNEKTKIIKMHDIIRDYLISEFSKQDYYYVIKNICSYYYKINDLYNCSVFSVLLRENDFGNYEKLLTQCVLKAIKEENYTYLISLGNHYFDYNVLNKNNLYHIIAYGYILALLSIGDYPSAKMFADIEELSISSSIECNEFDLALQISDLYHLQSNYITAIDLYETILLYLDSNKQLKYIINCETKIAHSYRHIGNYPEAIKHYYTAIKKATSINDFNTIILCNLELSVIYLSNPKYLKNEARYLNLDELFEHTNKLIIDNQNKISELLYYRNYARYLISKSNIDKYSNEIQNNLNKALLGYENLKKRLIYTMYFEFGEYYRFCKNTEKSLKNYKSAISFSKKNGDKNLETMSYLGIILLELSSKSFILNRNIDEQKELLSRIIGISEKYNLCINKTIASLLLSVLNKEQMNEDILKYLSVNGLEKTADTIKENNFRINNIQLFMV